MTRLIWMILSATLCLLGFAAVIFASSPAGAAYAPDWFPQDLLTVMVLAALVATGLAFALMLVVPACVDGWDTGRARRHLLAFRRAQAEENIDSVDLLPALSAIPWLARRTESYFRVVGLIDPRTHSLNRSAFGAVSAGPHLGPDSTVDRRLGVSFFRGFPLLFFGLGAAGALLWLQNVSASGPIEPMIEPMNTLPALVLVTLAALSARLVLDLLVALRRRQADEFCREVEALAHRELPNPLGDMTTTLNGSLAALRDRVSMAMNAVLDRSADESSDTLSNLANGVNATLAHLGEIIETNRLQLQASAEASAQIRQTWHEIVEVLVPTIERLVDLHAQLSRLIDGTDRSEITQASEQLTSLAQSHREALDTMRQVADQIRAIAGSRPEGLHGADVGQPPLPVTEGAPAVASGASGQADRDRAGAGDHGLGRDLADLRKELAAMTGDLPDLPPLGGGTDRGRSS